MDALTALPGVGRKTANVVLGHALGVPGLPVDRHVLRVAEPHRHRRRRRSRVVEAAAVRALPKERWTRASDTLILHGRRICRPKPLCDSASCRTTATTSSRSASASRAETRRRRHSRIAVAAAREPEQAPPQATESRNAGRRRRAA